MGVAGHQVFPKVEAVLDDQHPPNLHRQCVVVVVAAVADCPSVACAISPRAATLPGDSKTIPELVNEKTDEDTGQLLDYGIFYIGQQSSTKWFA